MKPLLFAVLVFCCAASSVEAAGLAYTRSVKLLADPAVVVLDVRPLARCEEKSVEGARCLPAEDLLGPHGRLPDFRQIMWLFGTEGLSGSETVVVIGDQPLRRDFVGGLLYLAGQRKIWILRRNLRGVVDAGEVATAKGQRRSQIADPIYQGAVRGDLVVWREELRRALSSMSPPRLLDGRSPQAYDGAFIAALRGGHIPGAESLPVAALRNGASLRPTAASLDGAVVYASGPLTGIAYFTQLTAGMGAKVRIFIGGWRDWAAHTALPVDDETFASPGMVVGVSRRGGISPWVMPLMAFVAAIGGGLMAAGALMLKRRS